MSQHDPIERPSHYCFSRIEPIDVIEAWGLGFHLGNVVKYIARAGRKGSRMEDIRKAHWYLGRELQRETKRQTESISAGPARWLPSWVRAVLPKRRLSQTALARTTNVK